jgi:hypothetical protein
MSAHARHESVMRKTKASMGEALVCEYFRFAGWAVSRTGIETVIDHIDDVEPDTGDVGHLPDLLVSKVAGSSRNVKTQELGQAFYVEVKAHRNWTPRNCSRYQRWGNVLLVWVSPKGLMGTWISRPGDAAVKTVVKEADFVELAKVGVVSIGHCEDKACEATMRKHFDALAKDIAAMKTASAKLQATPASPTRNVPWQRRQG